jgi:hypothetical protein
MPAHHHDHELDDIEGELADAELDAIELALDIEAGLVPAWARRALYPHERRAGVNFALLDDAVVTRVDRITELMRDHRATIADTIDTKLDAATTPDELGDLITGLADPARPITADVPRYRELTDELATRIEVELIGSHLDGLDAVAGEARAQGIPTAYIDAARAGALAPDVTGRYRATGRRLADVPARIVIAAVEGARVPVYAQDVDRSRADVARAARESRAAGLDEEGRTAAQQAQASGRAQAAELLPAAAYYYASELLDRNTCGPCSLVDGREYRTLADARVDYPDGLYRLCAGGPRCRGTLVTVWDSEAAPTPPSTPPRSGPATPAPPTGGPELVTVALPNGAGINKLDVLAAYPGAVTAADLEGARFAITGGAIHGTDVYDTVGTFHRGRLITVERSRPGRNPLTPEDIDARIDALAGWTDTVPDRLTGSVETVHSSLGVSSHWGSSAAATSNGPEIVVWSDWTGRDELATLIELLDHESGHSSIAYLNESLKVLTTGRPGGLYRSLTEADARRLIADIAGRDVVPEVDKFGRLIGFREYRPDAPPPLELIDARRTVTSPPELDKIIERMLGDGIPRAEHVDRIEPYIEEAANKLIAERDALRGRLIPDDELNDNERALIDLGIGNRTTPGAGWNDATIADGKRLATVAPIEEELVKRATGSRILARFPRRLTEDDKAEELDKVLKAIKALRRADKRDAMRLAGFTETGRPDGSFAIRTEGSGSWTDTNGNRKRRWAVTDYGASHDAGVEDWAESVRLYLRDQRDGELGASRYHGDRLRFGDLFPSRVRILDALYGPGGPA